ncbi:hypothetical protein NEMBOFW57_003480 [Staphylotrichum longicolle]|uniref:Uncharacterized protein n=1 Tax=Staphylotrichum longicolle TaxID=669026 RepID=A0AAD4I4P2_9PEZI|nr:hypothetical protein NEMBOFW57_003480 [Staphylotrichum longicolle]
MMPDFPLFGQNNVSQQGQMRNGQWQARRRGQDFDTQSVQTNGRFSYANDKSLGLSTAYYECICSLQVHVETTLNRFHDLYERNGRLAEARRLSEQGIKHLLSEYDDDRVVAALHLLAETYQRCELPQANEAHKTLMDWWEYLRHHRHPSRNPNQGEVDYEQVKADQAKEAAMAFWKQYNMLLEDPNRWLDTYLEETTTRERDILMGLRIQALNAADKENAIKTNLHPHNAWFDNTPLIPTRRRRLNPFTNSRSAKGEEVDFDKLGHSDAREAEKDRIKKALGYFRRKTRVMGERAENHQETTAIIDTGDEGPNIISLEFLKKLRLESMVETDWSGDRQEIKDASGNILKPIGWVDLYFRFLDLPGGWHSSLFWVIDVQTDVYTIIIGMPCLLQENIKSTLIAPLVLNQKKKEKAGPPDTVGTKLGSKFPQYTNDQSPPAAVPTSNPRTYSTPTPSATRSLLRPTSKPFQPRWADGDEASSPEIIDPAGLEGQWP